MRESKRRERRKSEWIGSRGREGRGIKRRSVGKVRLIKRGGKEEREVVEARRNKGSVRTENYHWGGEAGEMRGNMKSDERWKKGIEGRDNKRWVLVEVRGGGIGKWGE